MRLNVRATSIVVIVRFPTRPLFSIRRNTLPVIRAHLNQAASAARASGARYRSCRSPPLVFYVTLPCLGSRASYLDFKRNQLRAAREGRVGDGD